MPVSRTCRDITPHVSVIIVAFNKKEMLTETIDSLLKQTYPNFEIIVVDNNSTDGTPNFVKTKFPEILCIESNKNLGFAGGNNLGLRHARGEHIALLNNDAVAQPFWLEAMVEAMDKHPDAGICASKMLRFGTETIDSAGDSYASVGRGFKRGEGSHSGSFNNLEYVFGACAGAAMYRREMIEEIGFFDEDFFLISEDTDLNFRAQLAGWKSIYVPSAVVYHKVRSTIGHMSDRAIYYSLRNSELARVKNVPFGIFIKCFPSYLLGTFLEFLFFSIKHGKLGLYAKAKFDAMKRIRIMLVKRKKIMKMKKVSNNYLYSMITPIWNREFFSMKIHKFFRG